VVTVTPTANRLPDLRVLVIAFVAFASVYVLFLDPWGHDLWFHLHRLQDIETQMAGGQLRANLSLTDANGKAPPVFVYYSQWAYWPPLLVRQLGATPLIALKLVFCLFLMLSVAGFYMLVRLHVDNTRAAFGTLLYATSNYVIGDIFVRSAYPEFLSYSLLPLFLLALHRALLEADRLAEMSLVILASLMILFHPLSFMNVGLAVLAYGWFARDGHRISVGRFARTAAFLALAMGLTSFFWLPAVIETKYVLGTAGTPIDIRDTFVPIWRYLNFSSVVSLGLVLTLTSVVVTAWLALSSFGKRVTGNKPVWPLVAGVAVYVFLTLPYSRELWLSLPFLAANNFVWRLLFPLTVLLVVLVTLKMTMLPTRLQRADVLRLIGCVAVVQAMGFIFWHTWSDLSMRRLSTQEIVASLAEGDAKTSGWGIDEYRPNPRAVRRQVEPCGEVERVKPPRGEDVIFAVDAGSADKCFHVERFWNVRYAASVGGWETPVYANDEGEIVIVPGGHTGQALIHFSQPEYVKYSTQLSAVAALFLLVVSTTFWKGLATVKSKPVAAPTERPQAH